MSILCSVSQSDLLTFDLTWRFNQTDTILTSSYTNGKPQTQVDDQWKEQVQSLSDSGSLQLHKLTMVHQGTYSCELSTARDTHLILTYLQITPGQQSRGKSFLLLFLLTVSHRITFNKKTAHLYFPGRIAVIVASAAAVIIAVVICSLLKGKLR